MVRVLLKTSIFYLFLLILLSNKVNTCTCVGEYSYSKEETDNYKLIFIGKVIKKEHISIDGSKKYYYDENKLVRQDFIKYTIVISNLYKPLYFKDIIVEIFSEAQSSACGIDLELGEKYIIYANGNYLIYKTDINPKYDTYNDMSISNLFTDKCTPTEKYNKYHENKLDSLFNSKVILNRKVIIGDDTLSN